MNAQTARQPRRRDRMRNSNRHYRLALVTGVLRVEQFRCRPTVGRETFFSSWICRVGRAGGNHDDHGSIAEDGDRHLFDQCEHLPPVENRVKR